MLHPAVIHHVSPSSKPWRFEAERSHCRDPVAAVASSGAISAIGAICRGVEVFRGVERGRRGRPGEDSNL